jgi:O-antigen ligase
MNANAAPMLSRERVLLPLVLVLAALAALAVLPVLIMRETDALRDRITRFVVPARALVTRIQSAIALEARRRVATSSRAISTGWMSSKMRTPNSSAR